MLMSAATGLPSSLIVTGRWLCRAWATSSPRCVCAAVSGYATDGRSHRARAIAEQTNAQSWRQPLR